MLSIKKLLAEAMPAKCLIILGWIIDTRYLLIQLPENKFLASTLAINKLLAKPKVKHADIEWLIEHLNHAGFINLSNVPSFPWPTVTCLVRSVSPTHDVETGPTR
jgi:hypothetical protein